MADATIYCDGTANAYAITSAGTPNFVVAENVEDEFNGATTLTVFGSTANDGKYTIVSASYAGTTTIEVSDAIPDGTGDGWITINSGSTQRDGTSLAAAWPDEEGLQYALDTDVVDGEDTDLFVCGDYTITTTVDIDTSGGTRATNKWLNVIGCDGSGTEYTLGNYATLDATAGALGANPVMLVADVHNVEFRNIWTKNDSSSPALGADGINVDNSASFRNYHFYNCKATESSDGFNVVDTNAKQVLFDHCVVDVDDRGIYCNCQYVTIINCDVTTTDDVGIRPTYGSLIMNCIISGSTRGIYITGDGRHDLINNSIYNVTTQGIDINNSSVLVNITNNIIWVADPANDQAVRRTNGSIGYEDYNITNSTTGGNGGLTGANSTDSVTDTETLIWKDAATGDFRLVPTSIALNTGKQMIGNGITNEGYSDIGAWQRKSYLGID